MLEDCFKYYKGCQACQRFGKIQIVLASVMNSIIKPWPLRGWAMDMIGQINPSSSKGHQWVLAATDYFTKWVEAVPMRTVASRDVISFEKRAHHSQIWDPSDHYDRWRIGLYIRGIQEVCR